MSLKRRDPRNPLTGRSTALAALLAPKAPAFRVLTLVLAESELELVPDELRHHPSVTKPAKRHEKRPGRTLLDSSVHHEALRGAPEGERRGRPDLVHFFLLLGLDSVLNRRRALTLLVHTRHDEILRVDPSTRIMRNYNRFVGLVEQLLRTGRVPEATPLLTVEPGWTLARVLADAVPAGTHKVAFRETGRRVTPAEFFRGRAAASPDLAAVIGGFPKGDFRADVDKLVDETVSIGPDALPVWTVEAEAIVHWEAATDAFGTESDRER